MSVEILMNDCKDKMTKAVEATRHKFTSIRAGRASVAMLDGIKVEQYGSLMPLNQVGTVSAPEPRLLVIDPWDKSVIPAIEKAIMASNVGLTPNNDGRVIRLMVPELTADRRKEYVKLAKKEAEEGKVAVRNIRKDVNNALRRLQKDEEITEDELKKYEDELHDLKVNRRKEVAQKIKEAREQGDLSENAEYDAAKDEQRDIESRIEELEKLLKNVEAVDEDEVTLDVVSIGCKVRLYDAEFEEEIEYSIVGSTEADSLNNKISNESPVGAALLGRKVGETVEVETQAGVVLFKILEIQRAN